LGATGSGVTRRLINFPLGIGESPVWDEQSGVLWFVDIVAPRLYRFDAETGDVTFFEMPALIGSIALTSDRRILVALRTGVHLFDPETQEMTFLVNPEPDVASNRLNDGKVGPDGAFWIGSMHMARPFQSTGALYRVTADGEATRIVGDIAVSNGLAWSPDGRTMYHADSAKGWVKTYMEGQGETLMQQGSAWTQPPRIKHLILDYSDDVELLEVILPAEFKTVELAS